MGLIFNGNGDVIKAVDGSLTVEGLDLGGSTNINAGIGTFSGNLNVGGVLTYEDVKNVDSVGVITARGVIDAQGYINLAQKIIHTGDADTSIEFPSNNTIKFETAGSERLRITSAGALRLSDTASPNDQNTDIWVASDVLNFNAYGTNGAFIFKSGSSSTERLRIDSSGRLLLGTTTEGDTAADNLTIADSGASGITIRSGTTSTGNIYFSDATSGSGEYDGYIQYSQNNRHLIFGTATSERLRITSDGQIGVNNTSPDAWHSTYKSLQIYDAAVLYGSQDDSFVGLGANHFLNTSGDFKYSNSDFASRFYQVNGGFHFESVASGTAGNTFSFTERLRITSGGDVGVGNNSPNCRLAVKDVAEHTAYANVTPSVGDCMVQLYNNPPNETANDHSTIQFGVNGGSHNRVNSISAVAESAGNRKMAFTFCTDEAGSRTEKMRISGDGKIGINNNSPGGSVGSIDQTNSRSTAFSATTDQRALAGIIIRQVSDASGRFASLSFVNGGGTQAEASINLVQQGNYIGDLVVKHRTGGSSWRESLRIASDGTIRQNGATWTNNAIRAVFYNPDSTGSQIQFQHSGTTTGSSRGFRVGHNGSGGQLWNFENDYLRFATNNAERVRITSAGYMGINTTNPVRPLHIVGNDGSSGATSGNSDTTLVLENAGTNGSMIEFMNANNGAGHLMFTDSDASNRGRISYHHNGDYLRFDAAGQECMRIKTVTASSTTSGVVGINDADPEGDALGLVVRNKGSQESALPVVLIQRDNNAGGGSSTDEIALKVNMPYTYNGAGDCYGIKSYAVHNLNSTHFAGHFEARGSQYDAGGDGAAVYATIHKTDTNGPGYVPAIYAYARSTYNIASTGYAVGMRIKLNAYEPNRGIIIHHELTNSNWTRMIAFHKGSGANGTEVGSIKSSNNATQYNTSSDYRLKENVVDLTGAITRLKQLKPKRFNFKNDTGNTVDGFLAHEVEISCPQAVSGTKDAVRIETIANPETGKTIMNEDGTPKTETVIDPQEVDYSKLSTLTIAALQEAIAKIETLEAKVAVLEGS